MEPLAEIISSLILRLREGESPQNLLSEIKEVEVEGQLEREILDSVTKQLSSGLDDRSLFGRLVKLDEEGLKRIKVSSGEFLEFEPFKGVNRLEILRFWNMVLERVLANLGE